MTTTNIKASRRGKSAFATVTQAAEFLGVSDQTVRRMCDSGRLPCRRMITHRRIPWAALEAEARCKK